MATVALSLDLIRLSPDPDFPSRIRCSSCQARLEIHQPDEELPNRLLGPCHDCGAGFLIAAEVMVRLPSDELLRNS